MSLGSVNELDSQIKKKNLEDLISSQSSPIQKKQLFYMYMESKEYGLCLNILYDLIKEFGNNDNNIYRMHGERCEIDPKKNHIPLKQYKALILKNQNDAVSIKDYIMYMKQSVDLADKKSVNDYISLWRLYISTYMDDEEPWIEISDLYALTGSLEYAEYCLEEVLLHFPYNTPLLNKLGNLCLNRGPDGAQDALKFFCRSNYIKLNAEACFGILEAAEKIKENKKENKNLKYENFDQEDLEEVTKIAKENLKELYKGTPFEGAETIFD